MEEWRVGKVLGEGGWTRHQVRRGGWRLFPPRSTWLRRPALLPTPAAQSCAPWKAAGEGCSNWVPATHGGDLV